MADLKRLGEYLGDAFNAPEVSPNSPLYDAWYEVRRSIVLGCKPHSAWRHYTRSARRQGHLPWRT